jgi:hypothetical protein
MSFECWGGWLAWPGKLATLGAEKLRLPKQKLPRLEALGLFGEAASQPDHRRYPTTNVQFARQRPSFVHVDVHVDAPKDGVDHLR